MLPLPFFQKDDEMIIINPLSPFLGEQATILDTRLGYYFLRLSDGIIIRATLEEISPWFKNKHDEELYISQLTQMQHLAVDTFDQEWFYQIGWVLKSIKELHSIVFDQHKMNPMKKKKRAGHL